MVTPGSLGSDGWFISSGSVSSSTCVQLLDVAGGFLCVKPDQRIKAIREERLGSYSSLSTKPEPKACRRKSILRCTRFEPPPLWNTVIPPDEFRPALLVCPNLKELCALDKTPGTDLWFILSITFLNVMWPR